MGKDRKVFVHLLGCFGYGGRNKKGKDFLICVREIESADTGGLEDLRNS